MKQNVLLLVAFALVFFLGCNGSTQNKHVESEAPKKEHNEHKHWSYQGETGPAHWAEVEKNSFCNGKFQSPINIVDVNAVQDSTINSLVFHYAKETKIHDVVNNGHSIQYNFEAGDYVEFQKVRYSLKQIHFHEASEHTIDGIRFPLEIHMVHMNEAKEFLVLGVMVKEGVSSEPFRFLESYLPLQQNETKVVDTSFDISTNLPQDKGFYFYSGSLTTPPCTEGVKWIVFKNSISVSLEQVELLRNLMPLNNYRTEQALNGREVKKTE